MEYISILMVGFSTPTEPRNFILMDGSSQEHRSVASLLSLALLWLFFGIQIES